MSDIFRILVSLFTLLMQLLSRTPFVPAPLPTPTPTFTATPVPVATATATPSPIPTNSFTPLPSATPTNTFTLTATPQHTPTLTATSSPTPREITLPPDPMGVIIGGRPPEQNLPSAVLIYPLVTSSGTENTTIEMMNMRNFPVTVKCNFVNVNSRSCNAIDFFVNLTSNQPIAWTTSTGTTGEGFRVAPPLAGEGELKCIVIPSGTSTSAHNALQGRGLLTNSATNEVIGYNAIAFRRLSPGPYTGTVRLDGSQYEECPDRLHFQALASQSGSNSELILVPCDEDLLNLNPASTPVQFAVFNEFEQQLSGAIDLTCYSRRNFSTIPALRKSSAGTDTIHMIVRGVEVPVVGLVIDRFTVPGSGAAAAASNNPYLEGGRSATILLP